MPTQGESSWLRDGHDPRTAPSCARTMSTALTSPHGVSGGLHAAASGSRASARTSVEVRDACISLVLPQPYPRTDVTFGGKTVIMS